ncbi:MAG: hypothetical protein HY865_19210 [Chloroflexi bacterium]|nr:hypothetical protein [Chloroflexota bacterium]
MSAYKIFEQNGKYGLLYQPFPDEPGQVFLDPVYDSLQIASDYFDLDHFYATSDETKFSEPAFEHNCATVITDKRAGLVIGNKIVVEFKYQRIIKLTFCHYLCQDNTAYTLYHHRGYEQPSDDWAEGLFPIATISIIGELTLDKFLRALSESHPDVSSAFSTKLFKDPDSHTYISEYRYYYEWWRGTAIFMPVAIHRVIIENNFQIRPLGLVHPSSKALE